MLSDGARNNFSKRGVVVAAVSGQDVSSERGLELAIEAGAEDVLETEDEDEKPVLQVRHKLQLLDIYYLNANERRFKYVV